MSAAAVSSVAVVLETPLSSRWRGPWHPTARDRSSLRPAILRARQTAPTARTRSQRGPVGQRLSAGYARVPLQRFWQTHRSGPGSRRPRRMRWSVQLIQFPVCIGSALPAVAVAMRGFSSVGGVLTPLAASSVVDVASVSGFFSNDGGNTSTGLSFGCSGPSWPELGGGATGADELCEVAVVKLSSLTIEIAIASRLVPPALGFGLLVSTSAASKIVWTTMDMAIANDSAVQPVRGSCGRSRTCATSVAASPPPPLQLSSTGST